MSPAQVTTSFASIQRWEEASTRLMDSMAEYTNSCIDLANASCEYIPKSQDITTKIDANSRSLHTQVGNQLAQSRRILACARNKLAATFYLMPEEVLSIIFKLVMFDEDRLGLPGLENGPGVYYRQLYSLLGVCSVWTRVIRSQSELWTTIPVLINRSRWITQKSVKLSLARAKDRPLHLAAKITPRATPDFMNILNDPRHHFSSIDLITNSLPFMHQVLGALLRAHDPHPLKALTICYPSDSIPALHINRLLSGSGPLFLVQPYDIFQYLPSLQVLRLRGVYPHWKDVIPVNLVELRLHSVSMGGSNTLDHFITALAKASRLRKIELISITITGGIPTDIPRQPPALLPSLETLHIEDISCNYAHPIFSIVAPGSHKTSFYMTKKFAHIQGDIPGAIVSPNENTLMHGLRRISAPIHTLIMSGEQGGGLFSPSWLPNQCLDRVLQAIPSVTTLKIHEWRFLYEWRGMIGPQPTLPESSPFPRLKALHLSKAKILNVEGLKDVVSSHSLQKLVIGATITLPEREPMPLQEHEDIVDWLTSNVPDLEIIDPTYEPPEFQDSRWEKW